MFAKELKVMEDWEKKDENKLIKKNFNIDSTNENSMQQITLPCQSTQYDPNSQSNNNNNIVQKIPEEKEKEILINDNQSKNENNNISLPAPNSEMLNNFNFSHKSIEDSKKAPTINIPVSSENVIQMAKKYPSIRFVAIEMQSMALAYAVRKIQEEKLDNILFVNADAHYVNEKFINHKVETIFLNFSDPWPKKRHHKRRLTYPTMLEEYAKILKDDGKLIFKSDNDILFNDSVEYISSSPFKLDSVTYDYDGLDEYDAPTEYETRFRTLGTPIKRYIASLKKENK